MYAFVLVHFGDKYKYLELEIYCAIMLKKNTKYDIIYLYSINDTPLEFVKKMENYCTKTIPFDDKGITYDIKNNFISLYPHFNTLRTCNFLFAYQLIQYKKICLIESDTIITKNIDDIFTLKCPAILTYFNKHKALDNYKIDINNKKILEDCKINSYVNGGVILLKPSLSKYKLCLKNIKSVINNNCNYPNETLFLISNKIIYNLPYKYNAVQYNLNEYSNLFNIDMKKYISILHMNAKEYKHIDFIRDKWLNKIKFKKDPQNQLVYHFVLFFKNNYFDKYKKI